MSVPNLFTMTNLSDHMTIEREKMRMRKRVLIIHLLLMVQFLCECGIHDYVIMTDNFSDCRVKGLKSEIVAIVSRFVGGRR